jgi:hypothetical protein
MFVDSSQTELWQEIWRDLWHGLVFAAPTLAGIGIALVKAWPEKWLDERFKAQLAEIEAEHTKALEGIKHQHQIELEKLRSEIQMLYSRISKVHEKEFEVLPKAWLYLHEAFGAAHNLLSRFRPSYDFDAMSDDALEEFMDERKLSKTEKNELRSASEKAKCFRIIWEDNLLQDVNERNRVLTNYLIENRLFMDDGLRTAFDIVNKSLNHVVILYDTGKRVDPKMVTEASQELHDLETKIPDVEKAVQKRLRYYDA